MDVHLLTYNSNPLQIPRDRLPHHPRPSGSIWYCSSHRQLPYDQIPNRSMGSSKVCLVYHPSIHENQPLIILLQNAPFRPSRNHSHRDLRSRYATRIPEHEQQSWQGLCYFGNLSFCRGILYACFFFFFFFFFASRLKRWLTELAQMAC